MDDIKERAVGMEFNPFVQGAMIEHYKKLRSVKVFKPFIKNKDLGLAGDDPYGLNDKECDTVLRIVILYLDPQSPLSEEKDLDVKLSTILTVFNVGKKSLVHKEIFEKKVLFHAYCYEYFKFIHTVEYEAWFSLKIAFHNMNKLLRMDIPPGDEKAISVVRSIAKDMGQLKASLVEMEYNLFGDRRLLDIIKSEQMKESIGGHAEIHAHDLDDYLKNG
jgi:hypothetical protein